MSLKLLRESCVLETPFQAKVTIEGDSFEEVNGKEARDMALQTAGLMGLGPCGIGSFSGPYRTMADVTPALSVEDFAKLATWVNRRQAEAWDRQIESDAKAGRLDRFVDEALDELRTGHTTPAP